MTELTEDGLSDAELVARFAHLAVDRDNAAFYRGWLSHQLLIHRCGDCGHWHHPPRPMCPRCWSWNTVPTPVAGRGRVHLLMRLHQGPPAPGVDYGEGPHPVATVELDDPPGVRFTSTVIGCEAEAVHIGMAVELAWIERHGAPFPVFTPSSAGGGAG